MSTSIPTAASPLLTDDANTGTENNTEINLNEMTDDQRKHLLTQLATLQKNIESIYLGNSEAVRYVLTCFLASSHVLIEDVPGVGKTTLAMSLARSVHGSIARIQMTPDLMPADILGVTIWNQNEGKFEFKSGPIFNNILLADEINRTTPRTQSALLESMSEGQVSIDGVTRKLPKPFTVIATQNPFEFEGTYFLPESQLDRFLMRISLGYPDPEDEVRVLNQRPGSTQLPEVQAVMELSDLLKLQAMVPEIRMDESLVSYIVSFANETRNHEAVQVGVSTRGTLALAQAAKAYALLSGRDYVVPDDIIDLIKPVCSHRLLLKGFAAASDTKAAEEILEDILTKLVVPE